MKKDVREIMFLVLLPLVFSTVSLAIIGTHSTNQISGKVVKMKRESEDTKLCLNELCYDDLAFDNNSIKV